jgi:amino acid adenylation domain-containing protein
MAGFSQRIARLSLEARAVLERRLKEKTISAVAEPLRRRPEGPAPLSFAQQRLWFLDKLHPGLSSYNIPRAFRIWGSLDVEALERAVDAIQERHEVLRSVFAVVDGNPVQVVRKPRSSSLSVLDLGSVEQRLRVAEVRRIAEEEAQRLFDLAVGPLLRMTLLRVGEQEHVLLVTVHHAVFDGWSVDIFERELAEFYEAYHAGRQSSLPALPIQYADFAAWQRERLQGRVVEEHLSYWKRKLEGVPAVLELPTSRSRRSTQSFRGAAETVSISRELAEAIRGLGHREGATLFMTLLAALKVLLLRHSGQEDIVVGSPVAGRNRSDIEGLIGFFVNTLVLRTDLSGDPTFRELLGRVREVAIEAYDHQDLPFEKLVEELNPERTLSHSPLLQVMMVLQKGSAAGLQLADLSVTPLPLDVVASKFDLLASFADTGEEITASFQYNTDLFDSSTVRRILGHLKVLLGGIVDDPDCPLSQLPLLTAAERHQVLVELNQTEAEYPKGKTIHRLFEEQVDCAPEAVAVEFEGKRLTYGELNCRSNQLARHLRERGVGAEVLVGLCVERSLEMVVGLLGILKAGGAYLPLDPAYPRERLRFMLEDAGPQLVLTQGTLSECLPECAPLVRLDADWAEIARESSENPEIQSTPENLAYVIYTSGSTGTPKGVSIRHRSVVRLVRGTNYTRFGPEEVFLQFAPIAFDASTFEVWGALLNGGRLAVMSPGPASLEDLGAALSRYKVSTLWLTAGLFREMVETQIESLRGLRQLLAGGDVLSVPHVEKVLRELPDCRLINGYGPTESTTFACCHTVGRDESLGTSIPIGKPIANTRVFILDRNRQPVPVGVPGELYIGGDGLARDYFRRPELTAEKFVPDLFGGAGEKRLYRTGDRARYLADGTIEFLGRVDDQVKVRGFRVEPGEIESALLQHPSVMRAIVLLREAQPGERRLVAYLVSHPKRVKSVSELRSFLKRKLPDFMIPSSFVWLDAFPLTHNGKVDRAALPPPGHQRLLPEEVSVSPRNALEEKLVRCFERVLKLRPIGVTDNFFDLGGHSLLAVRLLTEIEKATGTRFPLSMIFEAQTVEEMAAQVGDQKALSPWSSLLVIQPRGSLPPLFCAAALGEDGSEYRGLPRYLGSDQPLYGLAPRGLDGRLPPHDRVEDMAAHYNREIRELQPQGPYYLGGWSLGGNVAFEMARQLQASGQEVAFLALLDSVNERPRRRPPTGSPAMARNLRFIGRRLWFHLAILRRLEPRARIPYAREKGETMLRWAWQKLETKHANRLPRAVRLVRSASRRAAEHYVPGPYNGPVTLFRAGDWASRGHEDASLGWSSVSVRRLEIVEIPGSHDTILDEPNLAVLGEKLAECLGQLSGASTSRRYNR